jgi:hypothetical protein
MAFHLARSNVDAARSTAERALKVRHRCSGGLAAV